MPSHPPLPKLAAMDLRLFAAIADTGGITAAAQRLGATKSLVSRELMALEDRLGTRLVHRTTRKLSLTETGELLASYARRVVEELEAAEAAIEASQASPRGDLRVSAPFSVLRFVLAPRLPAFHAAYPEIRLALDASMRIVDLVEDGIDVAIRIGELPSSSLVARKLAAIPVILAASPHYLKGRKPLRTPGDLLEHELLNLRGDLASEIWTLTSAHAAPAPVAIRPKIAVHDPGILIDLLIQGLGVASVPLLYAEDSLRSGRLQHVLPEWRRGEAPVHAIHPSRRSLSPKVRAFLGFAANAFSASHAGSNAD
jgi:DNA-binding transcriptional LysR family regulator